LCGGCGEVCVCGVSAPVPAAVPAAGRLLVSTHPLALPPHAAPLSSPPATLRMCCHPCSCFHPCTCLHPCTRSPAAVAGHLDRVPAVLKLSLKRKDRLKLERRHAREVEGLMLERLRAAQQQSQGFSAAAASAGAAAAAASGTQQSSGAELR